RGRSGHDPRISPRPDPRELRADVSSPDGCPTGGWPMSHAEIGVFGGSGFYSLVDVVDEVELETPYGSPSAPVVIGEVAGRRVAFLPRHGRGHELPPASISYRANVWAMRELGVRRIIGPCASGALQAGLRPRPLALC